MKSMNGLGQRAHFLNLLDDKEHALIPPADGHRGPFVAEFMGGKPDPAVPVLAVVRCAGQVFRQGQSP